MAVGCEKCALCGKAMQKPVKAHIIAKGLLELNALTQHSFACIDAMGKFTRRRDGLFINKKTCRDCEEKVFTPLDEFAIKTFREKVGAEFVDEEDGVSTYRIVKCNRQTLRAYFASLLYRFALGHESVFECSNVVLGDKWLRQLKNDLRRWKNAAFDYVDAVCFEMRSIEADSFRVSQRMSIGNDLLGFMVDIPHWRFLISVGVQSHPYLLQAFDQGGVEAPLFSLSSAFAEFPFCYFSVDVLPDKLHDLIDLVVTYNQNARLGKEVCIL